MQNHLGTVHVIAICNGLEAAMGALAEATIPSTRRWIPKGMEVDYTAKATSDITCVAETDPADWARAGDVEIPVRVKGIRDDGTAVVQGTIRLWVTRQTGPLSRGRVRLAQAGSQRVDLVRRSSPGRRSQPAAPP